MARRRVLFAATLCAATLCAATLSRSASATVMELLTLAALAERSDVVVVANVERVDSRIVVERGGAHPYTFVRLQVETVYKGASLEDRVVTLQEAGGAWVDNTVAHTAGSARYRVGERVLVFAQRAAQLKAGRYRTTAMAQGKYTLHHMGGVDYAERDLRGLSFVRWDAVGTQRIEPAHSEGRRRLPDVLRQAALPKAAADNQTRGLHAP